MTDKKSGESRRMLLKSIAAGSGAIVAGKSLPESWSRPVVDSVVLPAHAETTSNLGTIPRCTAIFCELIFSDPSITGRASFINQQLIMRGNAQFGNWSGSSTVDPYGNFQVDIFPPTFPLHEGFLIGNVTCSSITGETGEGSRSFHGEATPGLYSMDQCL